MRAQTQLTTVDIPAANAAFADRIAQAVADNAANIAAGAADRAQWLGVLETGNSQAIAAAQATLASSNVGGDPNQVNAPGDLAVPANLDLGGFGITSGYYNSWYGSPLGPGSLYWNGLGIGGTFGPGWGDVPFYAWDNDGAYGWSTSFWDSSLGPGWGSIGAYAWWGDAGMVAPEWTVFDPFGYGAGGYNGNYFANGFGAFNYGSWYGAAFGYWFGNWGWYGNGLGYSWLPYYAQPGAPSASTSQVNVGSV